MNEWAGAAARVIILRQVDDSEANDIFRDREHSIEVVEVKFEGKRSSV